MKCPFETQELWKSLKYLFAIQELWKYFFAIHDYELRKCLFAIH